MLKFYCLMHCLYKTIFLISSLMLIFLFSGKILEDEKKIVDYDIEESKFVVLMVTKVSFPTKFHFLTIYNSVSQAFCPTPTWVFPIS